MAVELVNPEDIPDDLPPGDYCTRLDESSTLDKIAVRFVVPPRIHQIGDCLVTVTKHTEPEAGHA